MKKFMILSDLDNTLLTSNKQIKRSDIRYIKKIVKKNHMFILCTGRPFIHAIEFYEMLGLFMPFVTDNGRRIYLPKEDGSFEEFCFQIDFSLFRSVWKVIQEAVYSAKVTTKENCYIQNEADIHQLLFPGEKEVPYLSGQIIDIVKEAPLGMYIRIDSTKLEEVMLVLKKADLSYTIWASHEYTDIEISAKQATKGMALKFLMEYYQIPHKQTIAFGDQLNDLSLIEEAYFGVAMCNAVPPLKQITNYHTTKDYNHHGVVHFLRRFFR